MSPDNSGTLVIGEYGQVENCAESALWVHDMLLRKRTVAFSLALGNLTRFEMSFVPLWACIRPGCAYSDGSQRGVQINIDRHLSYGLSQYSEIGEAGYLAEKWGLMPGDAAALLPFFNTALTGRDCYAERG